MNLPGFFRTRQWVMVRRIALILIVFVLGFRSYGGGIVSWFRQSGAETDIVITRSEFRPDVGDAKPAWIIGLRNNSSRDTYDRVELEATYIDAAGDVIEQDTLIVRQKLVPGDEQLIASVDAEARPGAAHATIKVVGAETVTP